LDADLAQDRDEGAAGLLELLVAHAVEEGQVDDALAEGARDAKVAVGDRARRFGRRLRGCESMVSGYVRAAPTPAALSASTTSWPFLPSTVITFR
jgi:hypothetical protein